MKIELIYDLNCPNVAETRKQLIQAFVILKLPPKWIEWDRNDPTAPNYARQYGSPSILVNAHDIAGNQPTGENCCRLYKDDITKKLLKAPSKDLIISALEGTKENTPQSNVEKRFSWSGAISAIPTVFIALLPKLTCPLCWSAYAGLLSALGFGFVNYTPYLLPLTIIFLIISLFALGFRAKCRHGYMPLLLGVIAAVIILLGKFLYGHNIALYAGIWILVCASLWNSWPQRKSTHCKACK